MIMKKIAYHLLVVVMLAALIKYGVATIFLGGTEDITGLKQQEESVDVLQEETTPPIFNNIVYVTVYGKNITGSMVDICNIPEKQFH